MGVLRIPYENDIKYHQACGVGLLRAASILEARLSATSNLEDLGSLLSRRQLILKKDNFSAMSSGTFE